MIKHASSSLLSVRLCGADIEELLAPAKISMTFDNCGLKARNVYRELEDAVESGNFTGMNPCRFYRRGLNLCRRTVFEES